MLRSTAIFGFGLAAVALAFAIGGSDILNHFYRDGAYLQDSGLLAYVAIDGGPDLHLPRVLGGGSFYATHVSPLLRVFGLAAHAAGLRPPEGFACIVGLGQALLAAAVFWALTGPLGMRGIAGGAQAALLALAFANDGLAIAILRYPHFETLIAGFLMLFLVALHQRRWRLAAGFLALALLTREDAGLHAALFIAAGSVGARLGGGQSALGSEVRGMRFLFLILSLLASAAALRWQHVQAAALHAPQPSPFVRIYAGIPPFAAVTPALLATRAAGWLLYRSYAVLPGLMAAAWAVWRRRPSIAMGYVAALPWLGVHLAAVSELAGTLSSYYAFPLLVAGFWPLLGILEGRRSAVPRERQEAALGFALMIVLSFTALEFQHNPNGIDLVGTFRPPPGLAEMRGTATAVARIESARRSLGRLLVDDGVAALAPDAFAQKEAFWWASASPPDTIVYFAHGFLAADALRRGARLPRAYRVPGTPIRILTDRPLDRIPGLAPFVAAAAR